VAGVLVRTLRSPVRIRDAVFCLLLVTIGSAPLLLYGALLIWSTTRVAAIWVLRGALVLGGWFYGLVVGVPRMGGEGPGAEIGTLLLLITLLVAPVVTTLVGGGLAFRPAMRRHGLELLLSVLLFFVAAGIAWVICREVIPEWRS
jgi:hypothetical protein